MIFFLFLLLLLLLCRKRVKNQPHINLLRLNHIYLFTFAKEAVVSVRSRIVLIRFFVVSQIDKNTFLIAQIVNIKKNTFAKSTVKSVKK